MILPFLVLDTTIAEMIKEETDAEEFRERIQVEQGVCLKENGLNWSFSRDAVM